MTSGILLTGGSPMGRNSPQDTLKKLALDRVNEASDWVRYTRADLQTVINFWPGQPAGTRDKIWRHFGMPQSFPFIGPFTTISSLLEMVLEIIQVFDKVAQNLGAANSLFRGADPAWYPEPQTPAFTIDDDRAPTDPPKNWPNGAYFQPQFATIGAKKKTEVVVHETVHTLGTTLFSDVAKPGTGTYRALSTGSLLHNASSYSTFVLDCKFDRAMPLNPNE